MYKYICKRTLYLVMAIHSYYKKMYMAFISVGEALLHSVIDLSLKNIKSYKME